ncbi:FHA domain-containing protein [Nocardia panacis]|uniref:FHA domain-containing protein n=1 Tax=Nocardia panacis TaxID=2340916 RepID=UPI001EF0A10F|nr:FHA domain-containing protein [Nocardia panacis]
MNDRQVEVLPGGHLVAVVAGVVIVVAHREGGAPTVDSASRRTLVTLSGLVREAAGQQGRGIGRVIARLATGWLMGLAENSVEFGVISPADTGIAVFLHGGVTAVLSWGGRSEVLRGRDAGFTVDRVVAPMPEVGVGILVDGSGREALPERGIHALEAGTVSGSGAVVWFGGASDPAAAPRIHSELLPAQHRDAKSGGVPTDHELAIDGDETAASIPVSREVQLSQPIAASPSGVLVKGFKCARHHLNDPRVSFCAVCGIRMDQLTCVLTDGIRPPLGLLLLDDGNQFVLDNDCVLGREPEHSDAVRLRGARPIRIEDRSGGMSRAHAEIRLIDWDVTVVDGGSTNGTHIRLPGAVEWTRAVPGHPVKLPPGAQVSLGGRLISFDSQHGQVQAR